MKIRRFFSKLKQNKVLKNMKFYGKNFDIDCSVRFKNPQYMSIGDNVYIANNGVVEAWDEYENEKFNPKLVIGNNVKINVRCHIGVINSVIIGDGTLLGSNVTIIDHAHGSNSFEELEIPPAERNLYSKGPITIGKNVWICENAIILPGVTIGDGVVVGANAVVTHDIPSNCVVGGAPAKIIKEIK